MLEFTITDLFHIEARGTVFTGTVEAGQINVGARLKVQSPLASADFVVRGLERDRQLISKATQGESVAVMATPFNLDDVADGFRRLETGGFEITSLKLVERPKKFWEFWHS